ncbi:KGG domain-containing protein [Massilia soli]|uniref:KGG domain-containing protein n=1 Tax=Massilia soli TaxID=2792854 RepID=A0ABS7SR69_9BURK|nr:KGG domain-containing protein [Massilia soli]MBZ2208439.1 KGG domain-containing protein [Massilia soli]
MATNNPGNKQSGSGTSNRGFASMDPQRQREIASEGGKAAHQKGTAHEFTSEEARRAGSMSHGNRQSANASTGMKQDSGSKQGGQQSDSNQSDSKPGAKQGSKQSDAKSASKQSASQSGSRSGSKPGNR